MLDVHPMTREIAECTAKARGFVVDDVLLQNIAVATLGEGWSNPAGMISAIEKCFANCSHPR